MDREPGAGPPGVERDLGMISEALEELRELAPDKEKAGEGRVYDFSIRWGVLMSGRLRRLEHFRRSGELTPEQERGYRDLRRALKEEIPQMKSLGFSLPAVPLED